MEEKYLKMLDEDILTFIRQTEEFYPADAVSASIAEQRRYYDTLCKAFDAVCPDTVTASDNRIEAAGREIPIRDYVCRNRNPKVHIVFYHGGGYILGSLESHDSICAEICAQTGLSVTAVDYRLAPEHLHPAAFEDVLQAFQHIATEKGLPVILVGDSAGGNLAAAVSHAARAHSAVPAGQVLIYPALGGDMSKGSYVTHANAPLLTVADMEFYHEIRMPKGVRKDVTSMPLMDRDFSSLPPTVIFSAECDPLADDGREYRDRILDGGGRAAWLNEQGLVHGYLRARASAKRASDGFARICDAITMLADWRWESIDTGSAENG